MDCSTRASPIAEASRHLMLTADATATAIPLAVATAPARASNLQRQVRRFTRNRMALAGLAHVALLVLVALFAPLIAPYPEDAAGAVHAQDALLPPSPAHLFGTDDLGGDVF